MQPWNPAPIKRRTPLHESRGVRATAGCQHGDVKGLWRGPVRDRAVQAAGLAATAAMIPLAVAGDAARLIRSPWLIALDIAVGLVFALAALVAAVAPLERLLMWLVGAVWLVGSFLPGAESAHQGMLVVALLAYPAGRIRGAAGWTLTGLAIAVGFGGVPQVLVAALFAAVAARTAMYHPRTVRRYPIAAAVAVAVVLLGEWVVAWFSPAAFDPDTAMVVYDVSLVAVAVALPVAARAAATDRTRLADRILLADAVGLDGLGDAIAATLDDPSVAVLRWDAAVAAELTRARIRWLRVDDAGGRPVAMVRHASDVLGDERAATSIGAAVRLVLTRLRLQREQEELLRLRAGAQARLVAASDRQRERIASQLRQRVEARLVRAGSALASVRPDPGNGDASAALDVVVWELGSAIRDIGAQMRAVPQFELGDGRLDDALRSLARTCPVPVGITVAAVADQASETALFYVCCEALANAIKHAGADRVTIEVWRSGDAIHASVVDDGRGGADLSGSGLQGLADRLAAIGGRLRIESPSGAGTTVVATIPSG
jgi:signal transduction histidine kinase